MSRPPPPQADLSGDGHENEHKSTTFVGTLTESIQTPSISCPNSTQEQGKDETPRSAIQPHDEQSSHSVMRTGGEEELVMTNIRATDVALGLRRVPAGFYVTVFHSGLEWKTENKPSSVSSDVIEWTGPVPLPLASSAAIRLEVYASFEFQPTLGTGEVLRKLTVTVEQLFDCSVRHVPFALFPKDEDVVSPCSSIAVTVERRRCQSNELPVSGILGPRCSTTESRSELEDVADQGHNALSRYRKYGEKRDLERSIELFERVLCLCPLDHPCRAAAQSNLATAQFILCQTLETDFLLPITLYRKALAARPPGHADRPSTLIQIAVVHFACFQKSKDRVEGAQVERLLDEAIHLSSPASHESRTAMFMVQLYAACRVGFVQPDVQSSAEQYSTAHLTDEDFNTLSVQLLERFEQYSDPADLEQSISILKRLVHFTSGLEEQYCARVGNLGVALRHRFEYLGNLGDLEDAILAHRKAVNLTPPGHTDKASYLGNLGSALFTRFNHLGELRDLEDAILVLRDAVDTTQDDHDRPKSLSNLGVFLKTRFEHFRELRDIEESISVLGLAVDLTPHGHPDEPRYLGNLGASFLDRFKQLGELGDLQDAISALGGTVFLTPLGHIDQAGHLSNLGISLSIRFEHLGELRDLEHAISVLRAAVDLTPDGHVHKPSRLNNLGDSLRIRFDHLGERRDLDDAISVLTDAVDITPYGRLFKPACLNNLGLSFITRFDCLGELKDLENAISVLRDAIDLTPHGHPDKPSRLSNLGLSFKRRFLRLEELKDIEDAISVLRDANDLTPHSHPAKARYLNNLGGCFAIRFEHVGVLEDVDNAISVIRDAVDLTPSIHPERPRCLHSLGTCFRMRFEHLGQLRDLEAAIAIYSYASSSPIGSIGDRFRSSREWISCARRIHHQSLLHAYSVAVDLFPQLAWIGLSLSRRYFELSQGADVVREAAAAALDAGLPETAVEWLERGRSVVWGELFQLRSSYDELSSAHPDHARRLQELSAALEHASATHEQSLFAPSEHMQGTTDRPLGLPQQQADRHRALAIERDRLLQEIRRFPGFEGFLRHKQFCQLRASTHAGPVVILNAAESRCDALIVLAGVDHVLHVPLPTFTFNQSIYLQNMMKSFVRSAREGHSVMIWDDVNWESLLYHLWKRVVKPVLDGLAYSTTGDLSRIFWCPTGPFMFLPIHAAGLYGEQYLPSGHKVVDFVISSYIPSLAMLAPSSSPSVAPSNALRFLIVPQPYSDGQSRLPGVVTELEYVRNVIRNSSSARTTLVESSLGTVEEVVGLMKEADWVHFACHGAQDGLDSGLCLADRRRLKVRDIIALSRPRGGLAFLSACQTAMGEEHLSDEAIHIAAGMLSAGYGGVLGTMWSISDSLAPVVAREVYEYLFHNGRRPDYREAARALHEAIKNVRDRDRTSFEWVPFIHVGL